MQTNKRKIIRHKYNLKHCTKITESIVNKIESITKNLNFCVGPFYMYLDCFSLAAGWALCSCKFFSVSRMYFSKSSTLSSRVTLFEDGLFCSTLSIELCASFLADKRGLFFSSWLIGICAVSFSLVPDMRGLCFQFQKIDLPAVRRTFMA